MKQRLVIVILMTAFSLALCLFSLFYVRSSMAAYSTQPRFSARALA